MKPLSRKIIHINTILLCFALILAWSCGGDSEEIISPVEIKLGEFISDDTYKVFPGISDNFGIAEFRLWTPESSEPLRAVLVLIHSYNSNGLGYAYSDYWQEFAKKKNVALLSVHFKNLEGSSSTYTEAYAGTGKALLNSLEKLAENIGKAYIKDLPFLMRGYSAGGVFSNSFSDFDPERVLAFANIRGGGLSPTSDSNIGTPVIMFYGELDAASRNDRIIQAVSVKRKMGANWTLIMEPDMNHFGSLTGPESLIQIFFSKVLDKRLANGSGQLKEILEVEGWLGDNTSLEVYSFNNYPYDKSNASWLIDEEFSGKWLDFQAK